MVTRLFSSVEFVAGSKSVTVLSVDLVVGQKMRKRELLVTNDEEQTHDMPIV